MISPVTDKTTNTNLASTHTGGPICLYLGSVGEGKRAQRIPGFLNVDIRKSENTDVITDLSDLSMFKDKSVHEIYASHCLEHFSHRKTISVLSEWRRVLEKGRKAYISVPDFDALVKIYNQIGMGDYIRNMMYGDQEYPEAFHYTIFTFQSLAVSLIKAGFSNVIKRDMLPYDLKDCSHLVDTVNRLPVSVNVEAMA